MKQTGRLSFPIPGILPATVLLTLYSLFPVQGQALRGEVTAMETISSAEPMEFHLEGGTVVLLLGQEDFPYLQGLRITAAPLPRGYPPGGFSLLVFGDVDPPPKELLEDTPGYVSLSGRRLARIPLHPGHSETVTIGITSSRPATGETIPALDDVSATADLSRGALALQMVPAAKGFLPGRGDYSHLLRVEPVVPPLGGVVIDLDGDEALLEETRPLLSLSLEGREIFPGTLSFLAPGIYQLEARAGQYLKHLQNVGVERATTTRIILEPHEPRSFLVFRLPSVAEVFLDGELLPLHGETPLERPPGRYMLFIGLGDFFISRSVLLKPHKRYEVGLDLDVLIEER